MKAFITDLGADLKLTNEDDGSSMYIPRYAVWEYNKEKRKMEVVETGISMLYLSEKYNIDPYQGVYVYKLEKEK